MTDLKEGVIYDFFKTPIIEGDYVLEALNSGFRVAKVLKINKKSLSLSCERSKNNYVISGWTNDIEKAVSHLNSHNNVRLYRITKYYDNIQSNIINLTNLNLLSNEIIENRF